MKKLVAYILIGAWALAMVNWKVIQYTRLTHPELTEWMHAREPGYAAVENVFRYVICPPCGALEPVFYSAIKQVEGSAEQQAAITHAAEPDWRGFYHLARRGDSWTFVPWGAWFLYWFPVVCIWWYGVLAVQRKWKK